MKKMLLLTTLMISAVLPTFAQMGAKMNVPQKTFTRIVQLGKGNYLRADLATAADLPRLEIDSITAKFQKESALVNDTLRRPIVDKRFDYRMGSDGQNFLTVTETPETAATFVFRDGEPAAVKIGQDTIDISGMIGGAADHWYRLRLFLNNYTDLALYKSRQLRDSLQQAPAAVTVAAAEKAKLSIGFHPAAVIQNYKNAFVPSLSLQGEFQSERYGMHYGYGLFSEAMFSFERTAAESRRPYVNTFVGLSFSRYKTSAARTGRGTMPLYISFAYLVHRGGELYDPHSFRLGVGRLNLFNGNATIEPLIYFHDLLKGVSPSIRVTVDF